MVEVIEVSEWIESEKGGDYRVVRVQNADASGAIVLDGSATKDEALTLVMWRKGHTHAGPNGPVPAALYYDERVVVGAPVTGTVSLIDTQRYLLQVDNKVIPMVTLKVYTTQPLTTVTGRRQAAQQCQQQRVPVTPMDPAIQRLMRTELGAVKVLSDDEVKALNNSKDPAGG